MGLLIQEAEHVQRDSRVLPSQASPLAPGLTGTAAAGGIFSDFLSKLFLPSFKEIFHPLKKSQEEEMCSLDGLEYMSRRVGGCLRREDRRGLTVLDVQPVSLLGAADLPAAGRRASAAAGVGSRPWGLCPDAKQLLVNTELVLRAPSPGNVNVTLHHLRLSVYGEAQAHHPCQASSFSLQSVTPGF